MEKRREINFVNVGLCLLVMLIHILSKAVGALNRESIQYLMVFVPWRLASFVVQGFIFLSALKYFMKYEAGGEFEYGKFLISRVKTILIPYILWNVIYYFALMPWGYFIFDLGELIKYILLGNMISHFYFVVIIIQFYVLMPLWIKLVKNISGFILIPLSLAVMIIFGQYLAADFAYNDRIFLKYIFYWICGCYAGINYKGFIGAVKKRGILITVLFLAIAFIDAGLTYINSTGRMYIPQLENIHIVYSSLAILFIFTVSMWKTGRIVDKPLFAMINRQSYNIYLSHCLLLYYIDGAAAYMSITSQGAVLVLRMVFCLGLTFVCWGAYDCIKRRKMHKSGC